MIAVIYASAQRFYLASAPKGSITAKCKHAFFRTRGQKLFTYSRLQTQPILLVSWLCRNFCRINIFFGLTFV